MIPERIKIEILTPHSKVYTEEVLSARLPGVEGYLGVFPGHTPLIAALKIGEIKVQKNKDEFSYFTTSGGIAEILPGKILVLSEASEFASAIDLARAQEAKERAINRIKEGRKAWDIARAQGALVRAINRIQVASRI